MDRRSSPVHAAMVPDPDAHPTLGPLLAAPPPECRPVAQLYRHSARGSVAERAVGGSRGGAFFVFCEQLGLTVFDEDLDVAYDEVLPLDDEAEGLLRLALLAHGDHPEAVEDYASRLCWAERDHGRAGPSA
jgi:hypothetical protein